jgi:hypothetical protein
LRFGIGPAVRDEPALHSHEGAVLLHAGLEVDDHGVAAAGADQHLLLVVDDLHRPARLLREHRPREVEREGLLLPAEAAADVGRDEADHARRDVEASRQIPVDDVGALLRALQGHFS